MKKLIFYNLCIFLSIFGLLIPVEGNSAKNDAYFELKVYHYSNTQQENVLDNFIQNELIPYLHKSGIKNIGVFKAIANDT
ncbi:MAG: NIPSNAP family containing protein, partial [Chitinophagaceae bacterium]